MYMETHNRENIKALLHSVAVLQSYMSGIHDHCVQNHNQRINYKDFFKEFRKS